MNLSLTKYNGKFFSTIPSLGRGVVQFTKIKIYGTSVMNKLRSDKFEFCCDQEGFKWRGVDWIHAKHFDIFAIHILFNCHIFIILELMILCICKNSVFSFLFYFGIVTYVVMLPNHHSRDFLFLISVDDMAITCDSYTKNYSML